MIYIQSDTDRTLPHHFDAACAMYGAIDSAMKYRLTPFEEVAEGNWDSLIRTNLFVGSVEFMREVFKRIGLDDVRLPMNSDREHEIITLGEAHERVAKGEKIFIKPIEIKLFTGLVLDGMIYASLANLPQDTKVMAYKPFDKKILSEWRIYVHNKKIVDARNYSGDFMIIPIKSWLDKKITSLDNFPCAYTIDVGLLESNGFDFEDSTYNVEPILIEFNDLWALGNYGMPNDLYLQLLQDRYFEIVKK
jgi:hypothetical protein